MPTSAEIDRLQRQGTQPTPLASRRLRDEWDERIKAEALFSARTTSRAYLEQLKRRLVAVASREVTPQKAEWQLQQCLAALGYTPQRGFPGNQGEVPPAIPKSITDLSSAGRIQLILDTNVKKARSMGQMAAGESPVFLRTNPAWRLERTGARKKPRGDWKRRWEAAGAACAWKGALRHHFIALKDSPIWGELGKGAGGFTDTLGSPYPPFAFGSGMAWTHVSRREWETACRAEGVESGLEDLDAKIRAGGEIQKVGDPESSPSPQDAPKSPPGSAYDESLEAIRARMRAEREREQGASTPPLREGGETSPETGRGGQGDERGGEAVKKAQEAIESTRLAISRRMRLIERVYLKAANLLSDRFAAHDEASRRVSGAISVYNEALRQLRDLDARLEGYRAALSVAHTQNREATAERYRRAAEKTLKTVGDIAGKASDERKSLAKDIKSIEDAEKSLTPVQREQRRVERPTAEFMKSIGIETRLPTPLGINETNPNFSRGRKWRENCQRCVPAFEARMRGYDVTALSSDGDRERGRTDLSVYPTCVWKNRRTIHIHGRTFLQDVERQMSEWGDGARAEIRIQWRRRSYGHVFFAVQENGRTEFLDPQFPRANAKEYCAYAAPRGGADDNWILRIDNNEFTDEAKRCFIKR